YFSIRPYPYWADMTKNPLTFRHIAANAVLPPGPPRNPTGGGPNEFHNAGEVWCSALWEVFVNLVAAHDHATAEPRMLQYVIGGQENSAPPPTCPPGRVALTSARPCTSATSR